MKYMLLIYLGRADATSVSEHLSAKQCYVKSTQLAHELQSQRAIPGEQSTASHVHGDDCADLATGNRSSPTDRLPRPASSSAATSWSRPKTLMRRSASLDGIPGGLSSAQSRSVR